MSDLDKLIAKAHTKEKGAISNAAGNGSDIYINTQQTAEEKEAGPLAITIGHEEGHAIRLDKGLVEGAPSSALADPKSFDKFMDYLNRNRVTEETEASHIENKIRAEYDPSGQSVPLRATYQRLPQYQQDPVSNTYKIKEITINVIKDGYRYYKK